jgi:transcription-repair coupling factor
MTPARRKNNPKLPASAWAEPLAQGITLPSSGVLDVAGCPTPTTQALVLAAVHGQLSAHGALWLVRDDTGAEELAAILRFWWRHFGLTVPVLSPAEIDARTLAELSRLSAFVLVADPTMLFTEVPKPDDLTGLALKLTRRDTLHPEALVAALVDIGYEVDAHAAAPGTVARRGGVVDAFPVDAETPYRIEFNSDFIDSLHALDVVKKTRGVATEELLLPPNNFARTKLHGSVADYVGGDGRSPLVVLADPEDFAGDAIRRVRTLPRLVFHTLPEASAVQMDFHGARFYHHNVVRLAEDLAAAQGNGERVLIASDRTEALSDFGRSQRVAAAFTAIPTPNADVLSGFTSKRLGVTFLTDREVFGGTEARPTSNPRRRADLAFIAELSPGDYVVHQDHGIGRFMGMRTQRVYDREREYFVIEYAGPKNGRGPKKRGRVTEPARGAADDSGETDKLFVPVESAEKLTKYIGFEHPKLHRLSGSSWSQVTAKVREDTAKLAQELLRLYAEREIARGFALPGNTELERAVAASFPYRLTPDQEQTVSEVLADMERDQPMDRLVCGDVGFGKTEVAIRAAARTVAAQKQVAVLAPTTILAQQHYDTFVSRLGPAKVRVGVLSRFRSKEEQKAVIAELATGQLDIVIGTHRLLSADIRFKDLGLIVIDEEQRFGVRHKEKLKQLRAAAHVLTLSATPIPRTLNLALSQLRDLSVIETPPEGRLPIDTIIRPSDDGLVGEAIRKEIERTGQVYYVYNNVEGIEMEARRLAKLVPAARIGVAHGQLPEEKLVSVMEQFDTEKLNVLVCSTIIENGLDLPNVNTLVVTDAPAFGLAQLYQLRGRIGRGNRQAYAFFLYSSQKLEGLPKKRLQALLEARDLGAGFQLALRDLEIRGTGNILGEEQHGHVTAIGLNLYGRLLSQAIEEARTGIPRGEVRDIAIDLPLQIGIPRSFIRSEPKRLKVYQQLALLKTPDELAAFRKFQFRRVLIPEPLENLFEVLELKLLAQKTDITSIQVVNVRSPEGTPTPRLIIHFANLLTPPRIKKLIDFNPGWEFTTELIKIDFATLGPRWLDELKRTVALFAENPTETAPVSGPDDSASPVEKESKLIQA